MPALRYSEDTEFNDALRARGLLPALPVEPSSPELIATNQVEPDTLLNALDISSNNNNNNLDEFLNLNDQIPASLIDSWKTSRLTELRHTQQILNTKLSGLKPIGKQDYLREVNQASEVNVDSNSLKKGTGIVLCLWNQSSQSQHLLSLLDTLSQQYPSTRFLTIPGTSCIDNYPDINQPTLICYRAGSCVKQYVGIGSHSPLSFNHLGRLNSGSSINLKILEDELLSIGILDEHLKLESNQVTTDDSDDELDDHVPSRRIVAMTSGNDSDSELDI